MERTIITINESGCVNIPDGNVWMSFAELMVLFDVAAPTLKACLCGINRYIVNTSAVSSASEFGTSNSCGHSNI